MMDERTAIERCLNGEKDEYRYLVERYQKQTVAQAAAIPGILPLIILPIIIILNFDRLHEII